MTRGAEGHSDSGHSKKKEKGRGNLTEYRGVMLMPTIYKVYMTVLVERLGKKVEEKEL